MCQAPSVSHDTCVTTAILCQALGACQAPSVLQYTSCVSYNLACFTRLCHSAQYTSQTPMYYNNNSVTTTIMYNNTHCVMAESMCHITQSVSDTQCITPVLVCQNTKCTSMSQHPVCYRNHHITAPSVL